MNLFDQKENQKKTNKIDLNFAIIDYETSNDANIEPNKDPMQIIKRLHNQMFEDQNQDVVVGYLNIFNKNNLISELPYLLQQMEYKKIYNQTRQQILVIFHYIGGAAETEPITLIKKARNKYGSNPIEANQSKDYTVSTNLDLQQVKKNYKEAVQSEAEPFKIKDDIINEEVNKLYFLCLKECEAKKLNCILIQINKVNQKLFTDSRIASRIFKILISWSNIQNNQSVENQKTENQ
ncbi:unnamed protein product [Paramecium primaurelia]|uniref:Uncharacterized protein n=1 Tax=Paramecium primaurelia TaxID=5886 RepID=A0A8S1NZ52_PARPR|nr:unnamed protein product [Paramecium primaurelia]